MGVPYCSDIIKGWCESGKGDIDSACHETAKEAGKQIMWQIPIGGGKTRTCFCVCSCLGAGTKIMVEAGEVAIEDVKQGQTQALAAGLDLTFRPTTVGQVSHAAPGITHNAVYLKCRARGTTREIVLTIEHPVLVNLPTGRRIVAAANLQLTDQLFDHEGGRVTIEDIRWGSYEGAFWELATSMEVPNDNYDGHLMVTEGIVTGDFAVTT